jgi:hypothetical protein
MDFADADYEKCEMIRLAGWDDSTLNLKKHDDFAAR